MLADAHTYLNREFPVSTLPPPSARNRWALTVVLIVGTGVGVWWSASRRTVEGDSSDASTSAQAVALPAPGEDLRMGDAVPIDHPMPAVLRRAVRTAQTSQSSLSPVEYERTLLTQELARLAEIARSGPGVVRTAAETVIEMQRARFAARARFLGERDEAMTPSSHADSAASGLGLPPSRLLEHAGWLELAARDALHHPTFHHDCAVELERLAVPVEARDYLTRFLLESVDEVEALGAAALETGAHLDEFPVSITAGVPPVTDQPGLYAAWLHRQSIIRILREMGVPVDSRFEHVLLNVGLGNTVLPYRWLDPR